jgi:hypothetical protein
MNEEAHKVEERLRHDPGLRREWLRQDSLMQGGLIAGSVALVQPLLTIEALDLASTISAVSFSIAIPLLVALLLVNQQEAFRQRPTGLRVVLVAKAVGQGLAVVGVTAAFWHVTWVAGVGLLVSGLLGVAVHAAGYARLEGLDLPRRDPRRKGGLGTQPSSRAQPER